MFIFSYLSSYICSFHSKASDFYLSFGDTFDDKRVGMFSCEMSKETGSVLQYYDSVLVKLAKRLQLRISFPLLEVSPSPLPCKPSRISTLDKGKQLSCRWRL